MTMQSTDRENVSKKTGNTDMGKPKQSAALKAMEAYFASPKGQAELKAWRDWQRAFQEPVNCERGGSVNLEMEREHGTYHGRP